MAKHHEPDEDDMPNRPKRKAGGKARGFAAGGRLDQRPRRQMGGPAPAPPGGIAGRPPVMPPQMPAPPPAPLGGIAGRPPVAPGVAPGMVGGPAGVPRMPVHPAVMGGMPGGITPQQAALLQARPGGAMKRGGRAHDR